MKTEEEYKAEVLQLMRDLYPTLKGEEKERAGRLFPELKENEDERTKNEIIAFVEQSIHRGGGTPIPEEQEAKWIAWLEKQGEHANFRKNIQVGDKVTRNEDGMLVNLSQLARIAKKDEGQGEQKPTDNVEPKFKVKYAGSEYNVLEVKDIAGITFYGIEDEPNHIDYVRAEHCEIISGYAIKENGSPYPTKPTVFSKHDHSWSEEDESCKNAILCAVQGKFVTHAAVEQAIGWLNSLKYRYAWKPSDEQMEILQYLCETSSHPNEKVIPTLMSLYQDLKKLREE